jgi:hypothetical protein
MNHGISDIPLTAYFSKMKTITNSIIILLLCAIHAYAQQPVDELIAAEKKFANTRKEQTTKKAFLANVDSACIGFNKGEQLNVFAEWTARKEDSSKLTWAPEFAIMASSGDIGVTTGPWEYRQKSLQDTPVAHGHFTTLWKKKDNGEWKAAIDMGINYKENITNGEPATKLVLNNPKEVIIDTSSFGNTEKNFSDAFKMDKSAAIKKVIVKDSWFSINAHAPLKNADSINSALDLLPSNIIFTPVGVSASKNYDMFIAYGKAQTEDKRQGYMRVWIRDGSEWKLLLMVIS